MDINKNIPVQTEETQPFTVQEMDQISYDVQLKGLITLAASFFVATGICIGGKAAINNFISEKKPPSKPAAVEVENAENVEETKKVTEQPQPPAQ